MSSLYQNTGALYPRRSVFNLSYDKKFNCDMGKLIPVMCDECVPGDVFKISNEMVIRFQPLVAPMLHEVNVYVHYFFVPYRLLWEDFETFVSGGVTGEETPVMPKWKPTTVSKYTLWDYLGFPLNNNLLGDTSTFPTEMEPVDFPRRAYNRIYNEYYRDENLQEEIPETNEQILNRNWTKDYFTSALPWQQRGTAPALPVTISGSGTISYAKDIPVTFLTTSASGGSSYSSIRSTTASSKLVQLNDGPGDAPYGQYNQPGFIPRQFNELPDEYRIAGSNYGTLADGTVNLDTARATTFDVSDLRLAFQIQKWLERNARAGVRYTEFLKSHFGVSPHDDRLQRPEYIGGTKSPVVVSEVLQTSSTDTTSPQGNLAGHGLVADQSFVGRYHVTEFGLIMGIMSIMPKPSYLQGINRQWIKNTKYDFYFPEFSNLSEQAISNAEIYVTGTATDKQIFGYQGRYDELRTKQNMICADMRDLFSYWHLGRVFANAPALNSDFITCNPSKRIFASQSEPGLIVDFGNLITAARPMPITPEPGLIDHN